MRRACVFASAGGIGRPAGAMVSGVEETAVAASVVGIWAGLDGALLDDGAGALRIPDGGQGERAAQGNAFSDCAVGIERGLGAIVFWAKAAGRGNGGPGIADRGGAENATGIWQGVAVGGKALDPVSGMALLCSLSQRRYLLAEPGPHIGELNAEGAEAQRKGRKHPAWPSRWCLHWPGQMWLHG